MKHSFLTIATGALALCVAVPAAQQSGFTKHTGDGSCPDGRRLTEMWEVKDPKVACSSLAQWDIARLAGGGSLGGPGYKCEVQAKDTRKLGHTLCAPAPPLSAAVGTFTWVTGNGAHGDTTLSRNGTCSNTKDSAMSCVWVVSDVTKRVFTINWNNGHSIDTMILSADAKVIEGKNSPGNIAIKGTRK